MDYGGYDDFVAEFYDYVNPYIERDDINFYIEEGLRARGPVLELGCGTGRVMLQMARAGVEVVGLDLSPSMLAICVERLAREQENVRVRTRLTLGDIRNFDLGRTFRLVTLPFRVFQHLLTVEHQKSCLASIGKHMIAGDHLILDLFNPSLEMLVDKRREEPHDREPEFVMPDGRIVTRSHRVGNCDLNRQIMDCELIYNIAHENGKTEHRVHAFQLRWFYRYEIEHLLALTGFTVEAVYGDYDRCDFGAKQPGEQIVVATKN
ncbi:MAG: class I SAM-dependent methyltransferase [bacterium]|nr:class I SAM-dependent methyltransferase [bacterium]